MKKGGVQKSDMNADNGGHGITGPPASGMKTARNPPARGPGEVRIIGGRWRGTRLPVPDAPGLRPTSDRARETLFNWLQPVLPDARVLDLFAGSGALGLEAVSRGARSAVLVEREVRAVESLHASIERLQARDLVTAVRADAVGFLQAPLLGAFDIVFLDPPFAGDHWHKALQALPAWLADDAWLYLESPVDGAIEPGADWRLHRENRSRHARHALYRRAIGGAATLAQVSDDSAMSTP